MGRKEKPMSVGEAQAPIIGRLLRYLRNNQGVALIEMAVLTSFSSSHLSNIETGRAHPSQELLRKYEKHLRLKPNEIGALFLLLYTGNLSISSLPTVISQADLNIALEIASVLGSSPSNIELVAMFIKKVECSLPSYLELYHPQVADLLKLHNSNRRPSLVTFRLHHLLEELSQRG